MIIPREVALGGLITVEHIIDSQGWDDHVPAMFALMAEYDGGMNAVMGAQQLPVLSLDVLSGLAQEFSVADHPKVRRILATLAQPEFCGLVFVNEWWMEPRIIPPGFEGRPFADIPGAVEQRSAHLVDTSARTLWLTRNRGDDLELHDSDVCPPPNGQKGLIHGCLRSMVTAVAMRMPVGTADVNTLVMGSAR